MANRYDDDIEIHGLQGKSRPEEEVAGEEILGHEEILGLLAAASQQIKGGSAFQNALAQKLAKRAPIVQKVQPTKKRRWTIGFGPTVIPPSTTVTVQSQPQCLFRGEKLINTGDSTGVFIQGLFVGQKSQLPTFQNPIAVSTYAGGVLDNELMMDTCDPALFITFQVQNTSATLTATWAMSIIGHTVL
jgi:hypothetical protein